MGLPLPTDRYVTLERFAYTPMGTFGRMRVAGNAPLYTLELPWNNNNPGTSCIPIGEYGMVLGMFYSGDGPGGKKDYPAYELQNVPGRDLIKVHVANKITQLLGCIAPGLELGCMDGLWCVQKSQIAFDTFMSEMAGRSGLLKISNYAGGVL